MNQNLNDAMTQMVQDAIHNTSADEYARRRESIAIDHKIELLTWAGALMSTLAKIAIVAALVGIVVILLIK